MGFWKEAWSEIKNERVDVDLLAGGEQLIDKDTGLPMKKLTILGSDEPGIVKLRNAFIPKVPFRLVDIEWEQSARRSGGKAFLTGAGGALVGGVVGAAAGAAIGGRRRDDSKAFVYLLPADVDPAQVTEDDEIVVHIECDKSTYSKIAHMRR